MKSPTHFRLLALAGLLPLLGGIGCSRLIGLDEFSPVPLAGGAAGDGGAAGVGAMQGSGGLAGTSGTAGLAGTGGTGGVVVPHPSECTRTIVDGTTVVGTVEQGKMAYRMALATTLGSDGRDELLARAPLVPHQEYDLSNGVADGSNDCSACVEISVDIDGGDPVLYAPLQGTLKITDDVEDEFTSYHSGGVNNAVLVRVEKQADGYTRVSGGDCLYVPTSAWTIAFYKYPPVSIYDIQSSGYSPGTRVSVVETTVTAVSQGSIWVQQGTGPYSGLRVTCPSNPTQFTDVSVGDVVTAKGELIEHAGLAQTMLYVCDTFGEVTVTNPGGGTVQVTNVSEDIAAEKWESVLVRVQGPLTVESVVENDPNFGSYFSVSGASWGSFAGRPWLYDTTSLPGFAPGATMTSVVGIVDSLYGDSRQDLMPRSAADFEGYTPAP